MNKIVLLLITIAIATLLIAIGNVFGLIPACLIDQSKMSTLPAIAISSGVLIASLAYLRDKNKHDAESELKHDEFQLQITKEGLSEVYELLKDLNNSRVVWIRAARVLLSTLEIGESLNVRQCKMAYEIAKEDLRSKLHQLLHTEPEDPTQSDLESLPPQFFYGVENWRDRTLSIDEAAVQSKSKFKAYRVTLDKVTPEPKISELDSCSVVAIYDFTLSVDESFDDPLSSISVWKGDSHNYRGVKQGPAKYLEHKSRYYVVDGKLHKLKKANK